MVPGWIRLQKGESGALVSATLPSTWFIVLIHGRLTLNRVRLWLAFLRGVFLACQLLFDQFEESWAADESLAARARTNDFQNFRLVFDRTFLDTVVKRMDENDEIFRRILDDDATRQTVLDHYAERLYGRLRADHDQLGLTEAP